MKEEILSLPAIRIYDNGVKLRETNGYNRMMGAHGEIQSSVKENGKITISCAIATRYKQSDMWTSIFLR